MRAVIQGWLGFFALGSGIVHLALVVDSPPAVAVPLALFGAAELAWGVLAFTRSRILIPRIARLAALAPTLGWVAVIVFGVDTSVTALRVMPMLTASLLNILVAVGITILLRRQSAPAASTIPAGRYLIGMGVGALMVGALTTPALAATEAGTVAVPHGTHNEPFLLDLPDGHTDH